LVRNAGDGVININEQAFVIAHDKHAWCGSIINRMGNKPYHATTQSLGNVGQVFAGWTSPECTTGRMTLFSGYARQRAAAPRHCWNLSLVTPFVTTDGKGKCKLDRSR